MSPRRLGRGRLGIAALLGCAAATGASAQGSSSLALYGSLDAGMVRVSDLGGGHRLRLDSGTTQPDRLGLRGSEDLGAGLSAGFLLEAGLLVDAGSSFNGTFFNRFAILHVTGPLGSVSLGHQPDFMYDWVGKASNGYRLGNLYAFHPGNFDTLGNSFQFDNAVRYATPAWHGFSLGGLAGAGEGGGRNVGFGAQYVDGDLRLAAAHSLERKRTLRGFATFAGASGLPADGVMDEVRNSGIGAVYRLGGTDINVVATETALAAAGRSARMRNVDLGLARSVGGAVTVNLGATRSSLGSARWTTLSAMAVHTLSRRVQLYAQTTSQQASAGQVAALNAVGAAGGRRQNIAGAGLHVSF